MPRMGEKHEPSSSAAGRAAGGRADIANPGWTAAEPPAAPGLDARPRLRRALTVASYAGCIALITYAMWSVPGAASGQAPRDAEAAYHLSSFVSACLGFAALYLARQPARRDSALFAGFLGSLLTLLSLALPLTAAQAGAGPWPLVACGTTAGLGCALMLVCWQFLLSGRQPDEYWGEIIAGSLGASVLGAAIDLASGSAGTQAARAAYLVAGAASLVVLEGMLLGAPDGPGSGQGRDGDPYPLRALVGDHLQIIECLAVLGLVYGAARAAATVEADQGAVQLASLAAMLAASVILLAFRRRLPRWGVSPAVYRAVFAAVSLGFLAMPFLGERFRFAFTALAGFGFFIASMFMNGFSCDVARRNGVPAVRVYGAVAFIVYLMLGVGYHMKFAFFGTSFGLTERLVAALVGLYIVTVAFAIAGRRGTADYDAPSAVPDARADAASGLQAAGPLPGERAGTARPAAIEGPGASRAGGRGQRAQGALGGARDGATSGGGARDGAAQASRAPAAAAETDALAAAVARISRERSLTGRETQTLALLAEGRNVPFIADELGLSADTVRTYIKGIHAKLGVHSRQELISFVRSQA